MKNNLKNLNLSVVDVTVSKKSQSKEFIGGAAAGNTWGQPCRSMCYKDPDWSKRAKEAL